MMTEPVVQAWVDHEGGPHPSAPPRSMTFGQNDEGGPACGPGAVQVSVHPRCQSGVRVVHAVHPSLTTTHEEKRKGMSVHMDLDHLDHEPASQPSEQNAQSIGPFFLWEARTPLWPVTIFTRVESILT